MIKKECEKILNFDLKVLEEVSFDYPQCKASKNDYIELSSLLTIAEHNDAFRSEIRQRWIIEYDT